MSLTLSKKRAKELSKLKAEAEALLAHQQDVLAHATSVGREAGRQAQHLTREELVPRVRGGYESYVAPVASKAGDFVNHTVVPAVGTAIGTALSVADVANDARVKAAVKRLKQATGKVPAKKKKKSGFGTYIAIGVGVAALAGVAYAVWQTFRADDELWVSDEPPASPEG
ncbi:hypothetical protein [Gryllotalpicola ginsengisoli]|uniref:hypothetical protein n=1 Tax=Gryllotalpicola ginsengisoli TaxID=444608 RepID=UPI0003B78741|nr:hypothetical protein [Gryllotalpicola ginsengisoli]